MSYHGLSNEEIIFLYLHNKKQLDHLSEILDTGSIETTLSIGIGTMTAMKLLDDDQVEYLKSHALYQYLVSIDSKLEPIVDMIRDVDPETYQSVEESFNLTPDDIL